jgi:hypothetical protein
LPAPDESFIDVPRWRRGADFSFDLGKFHFESKVIRVGKRQRDDDHKAGYDYHRNQSAAQRPVAPLSSKRRFSIPV